jgi:hypothetical protein
MERHPTCTLHLVSDAKRDYYFLLVLGPFFGIHSISMCISNLLSFSFVFSFAYSVRDCSTFPCAYLKSNNFSITSVFVKPFAKSRALVQHYTASSIFPFDSNFSICLRYEYLNSFSHRRRNASSSPFLFIQVKKNINYLSDGLLEILRGAQELDPLYARHSGRGRRGSTSFPAPGMPGSADPRPRVRSRRRGCRLVHRQEQAADRSRARGL